MSAGEVAHIYSGILIKHESEDIMWLSKGIL